MEIQSTDCPFCGASLDPKGNYPVTVVMWSPVSGAAHCRICDCWGPHAESREEALRLWSRRKLNKMGVKELKYAFKKARQREAYQRRRKREKGRKRDGKAK